MCKVWETGDCGNCEQRVFRADPTEPEYAYGYEYAVG